MFFDLMFKAGTNQHTIDIQANIYIGVNKEESPAQIGKVGNQLWQLADHCKNVHLSFQPIVIGMKGVC